MMIFCEDCAHFNKRVMLCKAPENGISPVTGEIQPMFASERRSSTSVAFAELPRCGLEARHFRPKSVSANKPWWKLW